MQKRGAGCKPGSVPPKGWRSSILDTCRRAPHAFFRNRRTGRPYVDSHLHRMGFTWHVCHHTSGELLPHPFTLATEVAVCFLWHLPAGCPGLTLSSILPCGARTFLRYEPRIRGRLIRSPKKANFQSRQRIAGLQCYFNIFSRHQNAGLQ